MPAPRCALRAAGFPGCGGFLRQSAGAEQAGPRPCATIPTGAYQRLREAIAAAHGLDPAAVLAWPNGAAELLQPWAAKDASATGTSVPTPGFADYPRALPDWGGSWQSCPCRWGPVPGRRGRGRAVTVTMRSGSPIPTNPTGQLWSAAAGALAGALVPW